LRLEATNDFAFVTRRLIKPGRLDFAAIAFPGSKSGAPVCATLVVTDSVAAQSALSPGALKFLELDELAAACEASSELELAGATTAVSFSSDSTLVADDLADARNGLRPEPNLGIARGSPIW
jgi:hypothetical protein